MNDTGNYRIKRSYSVIAHSPDMVELRSGVWNPVSFTVTDETESGHLFRLVRRLDGSVSVRQLAQEEGVARSEVETLLDHLIQLGVVERRATSALDHYLDTCLPTLRAGEAAAGGQRRLLLAGDLDLLEALRRVVAASLPQTAIALLGPEDPATRLLESRDTTWLLNGAEIQERAGALEDWPGAFLVYLARRVHPVRLQVLNRLALEQRVPWISATIDGPFLIVGPTVTPYRSACFECFEKRVVMNLREAASYQRYKQALAESEVVHGSQPLLPALEAVLVGHVAMEVINFALTETCFTVNHALTIHLPTMEFAFNEVLRLPGCSACGASSERDDKELYFDMSSLLEGDGRVGPLDGGLP